MCGEWRTGSTLNTNLSQPPEKWRSHVDLHHEPPPSQSGVQNCLHLESNYICDSDLRMRRGMKQGLETVP